jgi:soluble lytic murein transglycosylase-like protein
MSTLSSIPQATRALADRGVAFAPEIAQAAARYGVDPQLLAAVAAQETGGPGSNAGRNIVGDGGHGHGIFQIDDRFHPFASTAAAMRPQANADYAARMISGLLKRYGGDVHKALSAYNAGDPNAAGTTTQWQDGRTLGYADSVLRHYAQLGGTTPEALTEFASAESSTEQNDVNRLFSFASLQPPPAPAYAHRHFARSSPDFASLIASGDGSSDSP